MKTGEQVKAEFNRKGITITEWSKSHGFSRVLVHRVMAGKCKALRGSGHEIAVLLGMKSGEISGT